MIKKFSTLVLAAILAVACTKETVYIYDFLVVNETNKMDTIAPFSGTELKNARLTLNSDIPLTDVQSGYSCTAWSADSSYQADLSDLSGYVFTTSTEMMSQMQSFVQSKYVFVIQ
jgi:hypothetical protein